MMIRSIHALRLLGVAEALINDIPYAANVATEAASEIDRLEAIEAELQQTILECFEIVSTTDVDQNCDNIERRVPKHHLMADRIASLEAENQDLRSGSYLVGVIEERERLRNVAKMVDAWGNGLRHHTAHESKMVKAARAALEPKL